MISIVLVWNTEAVSSQTDEDSKHDLRSFTAHSQAQILASLSEKVRMSSKLVTTIILLVEKAIGTPIVLDHNPLYCEVVSAVDDLAVKMYCGLLNTSITRITTIASW